MSRDADRTREGLALVAAAVAFGIAADALARTVPGRLDVALGVGVLILLAAVLVVRGQVPAPAGLAPLAPPFALLAAALIWRDSPTLFGLNLLGLVLLASLASPAVRRVGWHGAGLADIARGGVQAAGATAAGALPLVLLDIDWRSLPSEGPVRRLRAAAVGLLAATPVVAVFGGLLTDADPVFDRLVASTFAPELDRMAGHAVAVLAWAWLAGGALRHFLRRRDGALPGYRRGGRLGLVEVGTVLAAVDLLFLCFVAVQFRSLFGGAELVRQVTGLSYAEYARQGFFQLVTVAALSLPLLLVASSALAPRDATSRRRFRLLATLMLILLHVMLASALWRMRLYTVEYGLTELRFYTTAFMAWLVLVFGWFTATVLRGREERFGFGAVAAALLVLAALNLVNPDGLIARVNLERALAGRPVDGWYLASLSADAVPTTRGLLTALAEPDRCAVARALADRWSGELDRKARWNISLVRMERGVRRFGWSGEPARDRACLVSSPGTAPGRR